MPAEGQKKMPNDFASPQSDPIEDFTPAAETSEEIQKLRDENKQLTDQLLRKQAEVENFRKRAEREKDEFKQYAMSEALKAMLPILDGFERALKADAGGEEYRKGIELIYQQLLGTLQKLGVKPVEAKGRQFNPREHEAVATVETDEAEDHEVVEEMQRGYFYKDRLLRPAMVKVAKRTGQ